MTLPHDALARLIRPRTIAVFGGKEARRVIEQCDRMGYSGAIWPVHPKLDEIAGRPCYRSVADLPGAPDASFIGVNRELTIDIVKSLAARGAAAPSATPPGSSKRPPNCRMARRCRRG